MGWISDRWATLKEAAGHRRYLIGAMAATALALLDAISGYQVMTWLAGIPAWIVVLIVVAVFIAFWLLNYATELRGRLKPQLRIVDLIEDTEPAGATGHAIRLYSVTVKNVGGQNLESCLAELTIFRGSDRVQRRKFLPIGMITQHQYLQHRPGGSFSLRAGEEKNVMLAILDENQNDSEIMLLYQTDSYLKAVPRHDVHEMTIQVYGAPSPPLARYRMEVVDGYPRIKEIEASS